MSGSSGAGIQIPAGPPTPDVVAWFVIFQLQVTVADIVIVLHPYSTSPLVVTDEACQQVYGMYHIYDRNPFVCILPLITITALFGEFVSPTLPIAFVVTKLQFCSHRLWCGAPASKIHTQPKSTARVVYSFLLSHGVVSPRKSRHSFGNNTHIKIAQFSNSFFLTGKCVGKCCGDGGGDATI